GLSLPDAGRFLIQPREEMQPLPAAKLAKLWPEPEKSEIMDPYFSLILASCFSVLPIHQEIPSFSAQQTGDTPPDPRRDLRSRSSVSDRTFPPVRNSSHAHPGRRRMGGPPELETFVRSLQQSSG